jgi:hypothetical protein
MRFVLTIDPKYHISVLFEPELDTKKLGAMLHIRVDIVKTGTLDRIPGDEPLFLVRGRDRIAVSMLKAYRKLCEEDGCTATHLQGISGRIEEFEKFRKDNSERMKQPGTTPGK